MIVRRATAESVVTIGRKIAAVFWSLLVGSFAGWLFYLAGVEFLAGGIWMFGFSLIFIGGCLFQAVIFVLYRAFKGKRTHSQTEE